MAQIKELKNNDYAYLNTIEPAATRTAVKNAFKYIVSLSNITSTVIDDWDAESVFKKEDKWLTDKQAINKAFFERKNSVVEITPAIPPYVANALAQPLKDLFSGNIRQLRDSVRARENEFDRYNLSLSNAIINLREAKNSLRVAELAIKNNDNSSLEQVNKIVQELPYEIFDVDGPVVSFICKTDTIVTNRRASEGINRKYNLGRLILKINVRDLNCRVERLDRINRWLQIDSAHFHHAGHLCWGGFDKDRATAQKNLDLYSLVEVFHRWKGTLDVNSVLTSTGNFNHHPAFTEYLEGDIGFGKNVEELLNIFAPTRGSLTKHLNVYFCPPMTPLREFLAANKVTSGFIDEYLFAPGGGPNPGTSYERKPRLTPSTVIKTAEAEPVKTANSNLESARSSIFNTYSEDIENGNFSDGDYIDSMYVDGAMTRFYYYDDGEEHHVLTAQEFYDYNDYFPEDSPEARNEQDEEEEMPL